MFTRISKAEFNNIKDRIADLTTSVGTLERKSRGVTRANAEVARLRAEVTEITAKLKTNAERYNNASDPAIKADAAGKVYALDERVTELFNDVSERVTTLEADMARAKGSIAQHRVLIDHNTEDILMLAEGQQSLNQRVDTIVGPARFALWQILASVITGSIAGMAWHSVTFTQGKIPLAAANSTWTAVGVGIGAAAFAMFILSFIPSGGTTAKDDVTTDNEVIETPTVRRTSIRTAIAPTNDGSADLAPTEVLVTESGAGAGARS